jgi:hypothetical protein
MPAVLMAWPRCCRDELLALAASASDSSSARTRLCLAFNLSERQATVVLDLQIS